jgi:1-acyl-sn-glycerol-3-phosphate acyltransferase
MAVLKNIVNIIYSIYAITLFFITLFLLMLIYLCVYLLNDRTRTLIAHRADKILLSVWFPICGFRIKIEGGEKIDPTGTYMFVSNHSNMLDMPLIGYFLQHYYKSLAKKELRRIPILGFLLSVISLFVDRGSAESRRKSTQTMVDALHNGMSILIFPEGTRNKTDQPLKSFYPGAFKTAILAGIPVQPFVCLGVRELQPVGTFRVYPGMMHIKVLDAIATKGMTADQSDALQERVYKMMEEEILKGDPLFKDRPQPI